jgi:hypothetical protein
MQLDHNIDVFADPRIFNSARMRHKSIPRGCRNAVRRHLSRLADQRARRASSHKRPFLRSLLQVAHYSVISRFSSLRFFCVISSFTKVQPQQNEYPKLQSIGENGIIRTENTYDCGRSIGSNSPIEWTERICETWFARRRTYKNHEGHRDPAAASRPVKFIVPTDRLAVHVLVRFVLLPKGSPPSTGVGKRGRTYDMKINTYQLRTATKVGLC